MKQFYDFEALGIQAPDCDCPRSTMSRDNKRALDLLEASCVKKGDRYTIGLPWKKNPADLPDNYPLAKKRLESLEKSLLKNPVKAKMYSDAISDYEKNGWFCPVTEDESNIKPVNYLPHHGVYRPDKASTPLGVVFDPASTYKETSLNSFLYKGPCLIGNLLGVLLRFREDAVGFAGDISKMYLQVCLPEEETHLHRYLWRDLDIAREPTVYRLLRVTFGAKPSPDMASYVLLRIAEEHRGHQPDVATTLQRDRYMDDIIHSCQDTDTAVERIQNLEGALDTGSFKIKEWFVSPTSVKNRLERSRPERPPDNVKPNEPDTPTPNHPSESGKEINLNDQDVKTLGVVWNPETDVLKFAVKSLHPKKFTKRNILSKMSTLYDSSGVASCVTIKARVAMQDIWRNKTYGWDDELPCEMVELWEKLFSDIEDLNDLNAMDFPRCLKPEDAHGASEMHVFFWTQVKTHMERPLI
ncbi:uncharacterized protein LOC135478202 [Liolophura sinensis]|uniref:uncharacterized protein LOC135478202 n=1 Tax=Liolophura sinensis TaxID=3198878 RepID=UPI003158EF6F